MYIPLSSQGVYPGVYIPLFSLREATLVGIHTVSHAGRLPWWVYTPLFSQGSYPGGYIPLFSQGGYPGGYIYPFHCWARKTCSRTTRFTVGQEERLPCTSHHTSQERDILRRVLSLSPYCYEPITRRVLSRSLASGYIPVSLLVMKEEVLVHRCFL